MAMNKIDHKTVLTSRRICSSWRRHPINKTSKLCQILTNIRMQSKAGKRDEGVSSDGA